jgi:hypothetical protein
MNLRQLTPAELAGYAYVQGTKTPLEEALLAALQKMLEERK